MKHKLLFTFLGLLTVFFVFSIYIFFNWEDMPFLNKSKVTKVLIYPEETVLSYKKEPVDLIFYFHGAGCDESFIFKSFGLGGLNLLELSKIARKDLLFISFGYDTKFHWSSPDIVKDTIKMISYLSWRYKARKIILIGISMGGSLALDVVSLADKKLKEKISDVLVVSPIIDYEYTLSHTKRPNVSDDLNRHFSKYKNSEKQMELSSPITHVSKIPSNTRIILVEGTKDTHICPNKIEDYYDQIKRLNKNSQLVKWNVDHSLKSVKKEFGELVKSFIN